ncbi:MAG: hypothetical protein JJU10_02780 [Idiomarina sp.]|nr:hypothetical protein [Idiomarina sp.]
MHELRHALLKSIGVRVGTRAVLECWTEVVFRTKDKRDPPPKDRPDGLLVLRSGKKEWRALVEAKVGNEIIGEEQVTRYLQIAKQHKIDAVITITNQFVALPTHHPVRLSKTATKQVDLFHWSWAFVKTQCDLLKKNNSIEDESQTFILEEISHYFDSDRAGISRFDQMNAEWKDVVNKVKSKASLVKTSDEVQNTIGAWHQEQRDICLLMSARTGSVVSLRLKNEHRQDPGKRLKDEAAEFCKRPVLSCNLIIVNAAADLEVIADLERRMIYCSMRVTAPKDKKSTKARANWLLRQLKETTQTGFFIRAIRPGKAESTYIALDMVRETPELIESDNSNSTATAFEVVYEVDLAGKFSGRKVFIDELEKAIPYFYKQVGERLKAWTPPPPKIHNPKNESDQTDLGDSCN